MGDIHTSEQNYLYYSEQSQKVALLLLAYSVYGLFIGIGRYYIAFPKENILWIIHVIGCLLMTIILLFTSWYVEIKKKEYKSGVE